MTAPGRKVVAVVGVFVAALFLFLAGVQQATESTRVQVKADIEAQRGGPAPNAPPKADWRAFFARPIVLATVGVTVAVLLGFYLWFAWFVSRPAAVPPPPANPPPAPSNN